MRRTSESDSAHVAALAPYAPPNYAPPNGAYGGMHLPSNASFPVLPAARNVPTFMGLVNALKRRWVLAGFLGLLVAAAAAVGLWIAAPQGKHQVKALLEITPEQMSVIPGAVRNDDNHEGFKQNQMILIKTRTLLNRVAQRPKVAGLSMIATTEDPAKMIEDMMRTRWEASDLLAVTMNGDKPDELKTILDELITIYQLESSEKLRQERMDHKEKLTSIRKRYQKQIEDRKNEAKVFSDLKVAITPDIAKAQVENCNDQLRTDRAQLNQAEVRFKTEENKLATVKTELELNARKKFTDEEIEAALLKDKDPLILGYQLEIDAATARLASLKNRFVDQEHPKIKEAQADLVSLREKRQAVTAQRRQEVEKKLRSDKREELEKTERTARRDRDQYKSEIDTLRERIVQLEITLEKLNNNSLEVATRFEELKPLIEQVHSLDRQISEIGLWLDSGGRIKIREPAVIMYNHNQRQKMLYSAMVGAAAFFMVITLVAFLEWRSRRVDSVDQVVNEIGMRVIGTIPAFPTRQAIKTGEADANQNWRFILNESVNSTRTMLLHTAKTQSMQVIMVTSAMQGEGKTSLSSQLATSMATAGLRTLIVDADLRNPSMHRLFDLALAPGCSEILLSELDVSDAVQPTSVPNLWVISAGQCSNRVIAALAQGHQLESMFNRLRGQFDFIVVDTCPVLPVADSLLIGQHVDGVVISILQDISQLPKVLNASERLAQLNIPLLGAVVNGIKTDIHAYGYNYVKQLPA
jgi:succinoglycan biosynthesis transport protein ExoP